MKWQIKSCTSFTVSLYCNLAVFCLLSLSALGLSVSNETSTKLNGVAKSAGSVVQSKESTPASNLLKKISSRIEPILNASEKKSLDNSGGTEPRPHQ